MKFKKNEIKKLILAIIIPIVIFALFNKVKSLNRNSVIFPSDETITINLSEIPQVPWDSSRAVSHVIETFSASVHGCLILKDENSFEGNLKQNTLLENYYCEDNIKYW